MPTYDYRCERTGEMFELWQSFSDDALTVCPQTHEGESKKCRSTVKKVFSKVGISFKGDGFYKNDHGSTSKPPKESAEKKDTKEKKDKKDSGTSSSSSSDSSSSSKSDSSSSSKSDSSSSSNSSTKSGTSTSGSD